MSDKSCLASIPGEEERVVDGWKVDESSEGGMRKALHRFPCVHPQLHGSRDGHFQWAEVGQPCSICDSRHADLAAQTSVSLRARLAGAGTRGCKVGGDLLPVPKSRRPSAERRRDKRRG